MHCPRPDRLGDSRQALPAVRHRGQLARLVSHFPVTHYEKLRRHANDFFPQMASSYRAKHVAVQGIWDIALWLGGWLKTICKQSGAGVWNFDINCLLACLLACFSGLGWSIELVLFLARRLCGTKASSMAMGDKPSLHSARPLGKESGGLLRRSCVSAIDFVLSFVLITPYLY